MVSELEAYKTQLANQKEALEVSQKTIVELQQTLESAGIAYTPLLAPRSRDDVALTMAKAKALSQQLADLEKQLANAQKVTESEAGSVEVSSDRLSRSLAQNKHLNDELHRAEDKIHRLRLLVEDKSQPAAAGDRGREGDEEDAESLRAALATSRQHLALAEEQREREQLANKVSDDKCDFRY